MTGWSMEFHLDCKVQMVKDYRRSPNASPALHGKLSESHSVSKGRSHSLAAPVSKVHSFTVSLKILKYTEHIA
jgi:hypothetical protein